MRDSNYRSITANRAAVTISTTLYDRRALDCTSDKPLVNSLNHLTFLASSSGKVRETLSNDGGLERLVDILYECKLDENNQNLDENPLVAWKWSLAFQCLVLVGTRGTEAIRKKVVDAGMIPVIATVLDNYLAMNSNNSGNTGTTNFGRQYAFGADRIHETTFAAAAAAAANPPVSRDDDDDDSEMNDGNESDSLNRHATTTTGSTTSTGTINTGATVASAASDDIIEGLNQYRKRNKQLHLWPDHIEQLKEKIDLMHNIVHLTSSTGYLSDEDNLSVNKLLIDFIDDENFALDSTKGKYAKYKKNRRQLVDLTAPRNFVNGILVPREDDVLWSLQLLAFISKYSYLKPILSETNIISGMSLRSPPQEDLLSFNGNFSNSVPALENDDNDNDNELEEIRSVENDKKDDCDEIMIDTDDNNNSNQRHDVSESNSSDDLLVGNKLDLMLPLSIKLNVNKNDPLIAAHSAAICAKSSNFDKLKGAVENLESDGDRLSRAKNFVKLSKILNKDLKNESLKFKNFKINYHLLESNYVNSKWNYATYPFYDNLNEDQDQSIKPLQVLNIFPLVEKFTVKSSHSKEIHYWAGVIMRNSCRRDESKGGVRQCACFDCGKWEEYPRQFAKCRRCKRTKYCSKECQSTLWEYHRHWCVQTSSSSSSTAPSIPSTSAATMVNANGIRLDNNQRGFANNDQQDDNESITSSINTTTTTGLLRQQQQQPLMTTPLGAFISPAQLSLGNDQPLTRATTPQPVPINNNNNNTTPTPMLAPTNNRGINFGTILFHNAVHATLAATNNSNNNNGDNVNRFNFGVFSNDNNNNNNTGNGNDNNGTGSSSNSNNNEN